jgi:sigma-B regulation protein RsbU (phosphoserine phosphatase)
MKKILIVDDEKHITNALSRELKEWGEEKSISFTTCNKSVEVPALIQNDPEIFLIISDMMMPGLTGAELSKAVKKINPQLIIFLMTGYSHIDLVVKAVNTGISSLILKPWNIDLLKIELESSLEKSILKEKEQAYIKLIEEELKWGGELQKQLLKRDLPLNENVEFSIHYEPLPALFCGGDYYDVIPLTEKRFFIVCADVAGHGIKAAFITTILKSLIFRGYVNSHKLDLHPSDFLTWLNEKLLEELITCPDIIITASAIVLDLEKEEILYSNAGHSPLYISQNSTINEIRQHGTALNFSTEVEFQETRIAMDRGDTIYFLTDGLLEIGENNQMLNSESIIKLISQAAKDQLSATDFVDQFRAESFTNEFSDDVTAIIVRIL